MANFKLFKMRDSYALISVLIVLLLAFSCKRMSFEPEWDVDMLTPIAQSKIDLEQLLSPDELRVNSNGDHEVYYEDEIFSYSLDSLFRIPDTSITKVNQGSFIPVTIAPGQTWASDTNNNRFQLRDVSLLEATLAEGLIFFEISSNITEEIDMVYEVPGANKDGQVLRLERTIPAASSQNAPVSIVDSIDLSGYSLDLRGKDKNTANTIFFYFSAAVSPNASAVTISSLQYVNLKTTYKNLLPYYGRGYFRQQSINEGGSSEDFEVFRNLPSGNIDLKEIELDFRVKNSIGVDISAGISELKASNTRNGNSVFLSGPGKEKRLNLNRATEQSDLDPPVFPQFTEHIIDQNNSNLDELLEVLPDRLDYALDLEINPKGNISGGNDFIYLNTGIEIDLNARIPLHFRADEMIFLDTLDLVLDSAQRSVSTDPLYGGVIYLKALNRFPLSLKPELFFMDSTKAIRDSIQSTQLINAYPETSTESTEESILEFPMSEELVDRLYDYPYIVLKLEIESRGNEAIRLRPDQFVHVFLSADFKYKMNSELY